MATDNRTILITGCSENSIGDALAREFQRRGLHVIATARTLKKIEHLEPLGIELMELDLSSAASIESSASKMKHLDILVNNAGINHIGMLADTPMEVFTSMFQVNVFGPFALTKALLPLLVESKGIIVNHTSQSPYAMPGMSGGYAASKAALANYTDVLRIELAPFGVRVMELVTGGALSNITMDVTPPLIPADSIYLPIKAEMDACADPETVRKMVMSGDKYAKKVVGDVLRRGGPPVWTWRGTLASTTWYIWIVKCLWKGAIDGLIARTCGLHLLKGRLAEMERTKKSE